MASPYVEAITNITADLIALELKVVQLREKFSAVEKVDPAFIEVLDNMTSAFDTLKLTMSKLDTASGLERSVTKPNAEEVVG